MAERVPANVPRDALAFFRAKDLRVGFDAEDVAPEEHAHAFTVAKAVKLDVLDDIRSALDASLAEGEAFRDFSRKLKPKLAEKGWWGRKEEIDPASGESREVQLGSPRRLKTIYRSNMRSARAAGQWARIQRNQESHPYLIYELGPSQEHRPEHVKWAGTTLPVDHPWWNDHMPPNDYGCNCRVRAVSRPEYERLQRDGIRDPQAAQEINPETGLPTGRRVGNTVPVKTEAPDIDRVPFTNRRTGEQTLVDQGLHPSWANNPGRQRAAVLRRELTQRAAQADNVTAQAMARQVVDSPIMDSWLARPQGELPVGVLSNDMITAVGGQSVLVRLTDALRQRPAAATVRQLPGMLGTGEVIKTADNGLAVFQRSGDAWLRADLTRNDDGVLSVASLRDASDDDHDATRESGDVIR